ncbi:MAG: 3-oxoacyl-ACP synthase III family protein [Pirellulales bacterium]
MAATVAGAALRRSGLPAERVGALIVATATPQHAMPSTACSLQAELGLGPGPAFDLNAACSGWLYALGVAQGLVLTGTADHVLIVGTERHSGLLAPDDSSTVFLFGDGAGAAIVSAMDDDGTGEEGQDPQERNHEIHDVLLWADGRGAGLARRMQPGYLALAGAGPPHADGEPPAVDPWIRLEGAPLFRRATEAFANLIRESLQRSGWQPNELRCVIPHQANGRILRAAARQSGVSVERFFINLDHVGNTSSASIPLALVELEPQLQPGDKVLFCSVGAGLTGAAVTLKW